MGKHAASERGGWGTRLHYKNGASSLNCFSLGDVVAYDSEEEANCAAQEAMSAFGGSIYERITVEPVAKGAWSPSEYDAALLALIPYAEAKAYEYADENAARAVNAAKRLLSDYAPAHLRQPMRVGSPSERAGDDK